MAQSRSRGSQIAVKRSSFNFEPIWSIVLFNPISANPTKWSNTLKQFVGNMPTNCLSVFDHFVGMARKGLTDSLKFTRYYKPNLGIIPNQPWSQHVNQ